MWFPKHVSGSGILRSRVLLPVQHRSKFDFPLTCATVVKNQWKSNINAKEVCSCWITDRQCGCGGSNHPHPSPPPPPTALANGSTREVLKPEGCLQPFPFEITALGTGEFSPSWIIIRHGELSLKAYYKCTRGVPFLQSRKCLKQPPSAVLMYSSQTVINI